MNIVRCKADGCGGRFVFLVNARGGRTPIDVDSLGLEEAEVWKLPADTPVVPGVHRSHYLTCKDPNRFRRRRR